MKRLILLLVLLLVFAYSVVAQITPIRDIQYTTDPTGNSPLKGQVVTISGIVTEEHRGSIAANGGLSTSYFYMADSAKAWGGLQIYYKNDIVAEGDSITVTGTVDEYSGQTELTNITSFERHAVLRPLPGPIDVTTAEAATEAYEGCLVRVNNVNIVEINIGTYKNWKIDDGSGAIKVDTRAYYYFNPVLNESLKSLTGIIVPSSGEFTIAPRLAWDIVEGGPYTRIQRIQQVRNSDLLRTPIDGLSDVSYATNPENPFDATLFPGDTVKVRGVVTMPTGLSYAGAGIKFLFSEIGGGPWSSLMSYNPDSTLYPALFEGDIIEMQGYITEYRTTQSNMTEFWLIGGVIDIVDFGQPVPDPDFVNTGDLRLPVTAEQWGTCLVYVKDAVAVDINPTPYELFAVDDGTGSVLVNDDSDSLIGYLDPPEGSVADSIRGWVYHHYGSYADSTTYVLEPLYTTDIVWGVGGPPEVNNAQRDVGVPTAADDVTISVDVTTNLSITDVSLYYNVNSSGYVQVAMSNTSGETYEGQIPAQAEGSWVDYFVVATDNMTQSTIAPTDTSITNYCYPVTDGNLTIADIQYTPWELADSPFEGVNVEITGIVTTDTASNNNYYAYAIQDAEGPLNGLFVFGIAANLNRGDEIKVYGTVTDYNADYHYKWDTNTLILADSFKVVSSGNAIDVTAVTTGALNVDSEGVESYEGTMVKIENATLMSINSYDATFDDGSGTCLVDDDIISANFFVNYNEGYLYAFGDTLRPGNKVDMIQGVFLYSFGTYKIEVRDASDYGSSVGVDPDFVRIPLSYKLEQNFPNPFNPETRIYFEIPEAQQVKVVIYNMLGQKVRTLINEAYNPGFHVINWDGCDDGGNVVPTGLYIYRIKAGNFIASKKMMMMK
jgi:DNA/RNA endonuclease YhcR with UshA esterase domain